MPADSELVIVLAEIPELARRLVDEHQARSDGRCAKCHGGNQSGNFTGPCTLHTAAARALALVAEQ